ncbi:hypothetical protein AVEN_117473-1 [Araneus ventricosus]|uniref:Uncharacterized protein n=1 Tax=Araneus ventricosus TaxID=182803 RepID=A0A4Y2HVB4_ARAVE|nr:hypothetical protein AVEN_117473-1 [Araneus ventricosus]
MYSSVNDRANPDDEEKQHVNIEAANSSYSNHFSPSSKPFGGTPQNILSYPKAEKLTLTNSDHPTRKTMIFSDTPNENKIEQNHKEHKKKTETKKIGI